MGVQEENQVKKKKLYFLRDTNGEGIAKVLRGLGSGNLVMKSVFIGHLSSLSERNFFANDLVLCI